jgi:hypothetical protein
MAAYLYMYSHAHSNRNIMLPLVPRAIFDHVICSYTLH